MKLSNRSLILLTLAAALALSTGCTKKKKGAMVTEGSVFPPESIIAGLPAKKIGQRDSRHENRLNAWQYHRNAQAYLAGDHRAWAGQEYEAWLAEKRAEVEADQDLVALDNG